MRKDFQTTRQMLIATVYPVWCYEERVLRQLARPFFPDGSCVFLSWALGLIQAIAFCLGSFRICACMYTYTKIA